MRGYRIGYRFALPALPICHVRPERVVADDLSGRLREEMPARVRQLRKSEEDRRSVAESEFTVTDPVKKKPLSHQRSMTKRDGERFVTVVTNLVGGLTGP